MEREQKGVKRGRVRDRAGVVRPGGMSYHRQSHQAASHYWVIFLPSHSQWKLLGSWVIHACMHWINASSLPLSGAREIGSKARALPSRS